jgi:hypothetical protein
VTIDFRVKIRQAEGKDLGGWIPGQPLPRKVLNQLVMPASTGVCIYGSGCMKCSGGYMWNAQKGEHSRVKTMRKGGPSFRRSINK